MKMIPCEKCNGSGQNCEPCTCDDWGKAAASSVRVDSVVSPNHRSSSVERFDSIRVETKDAGECRLFVYVTDGGATMTFDIES